MFNSQTSREIPNLNFPASLLPAEAAIPTNDPELQRLTEVNPLYTLYAPEWDLYLASYEGGPEMTTVSNLWKHRRENEEDFQDRSKKVHYINYCEQLVDFFSNFIFTETIHRDGGKNRIFYDTFITNVDRKGTGVASFMKSVCDDMQIFGHLYIMVDTPRVNLADGQTLSQQDEEDMGLQPYWVAIRPSEVLNWVVDDFGKFSYIKRRQTVTQMVDGNLQYLEKYTEIYEDKVQISYVDQSDPKKLDIVKVDHLPNPWNYIPIIVCRYKASKRYPFMGNGFLRDFSKNNRELMNLDSLIQEFLYRQCFNILVKESDGALPFRDETDGDFGTANVIETPKGASFPAYISPPVEPAGFLQEQHRYIVSSMFKRAAQDAMQEMVNGGKSSGFSQSQSFSKTVPFISTRADTLEKTETDLMMMTLKMMDKSWDGKIKYKDRYELTNITDAIVQLTSLFRDLVFPSPTFVKEELKRLVAEIDGKIPQGTMTEILAEIDSMDFAKWQETQKEALVGRSGSSPSAQQAPKQTGTVAEAAAESRSAGAATTKLRPSKNS